MIYKGIFKNQCQCFVLEVFVVKGFTYIVENPLDLANGKQVLLASFSI